MLRENSLGPNKCWYGVDMPATLFSADHQFPSKQPACRSLDEPCIRQMAADRVRCSRWVPPESRMPAEQIADICT